MTQPVILMDPTAENSPVHRQRRARPETLSGIKVGLLDISKPRGSVFLDRVDVLLTEQGATVSRYMKPTFARVAPTALLQTISDECDVVIEGLAD